MSGKIKLRFKEDGQEMCEVTEFKKKIRIKVKVEYMKKLSRRDKEKEREREILEFNDKMFTTEEKLRMLKSHYHGVPLCVCIALRSFEKNCEKLPIILNENGIYLVLDKNGTDYSPHPSQEFILEDITYRAWKYVMSVYDNLRQRKLLQQFLDNIGKYNSYRINQLRGDFTDFVSNGSNHTWRDLKEQVGLIIKEHFYPSPELNDDD